MRGTHTERWDPHDVFRRIRDEFGGKLALNCWVLRPGVIHVGDRVAFAPAPEPPARLGGWIVGAPYPHTTR